MVPEIVQARNLILVFSRLAVGALSCRIAVIPMSVGIRQGRISVIGHSSNLPIDQLTWRPESQLEFVVPVQSPGGRVWAW